MPSPLAELFAALNAACGGLGVPWYLFGAQAAVLYGAARLTADADVTVQLGGRTVRELADALQAKGFEMRVPDVEAFAERTRVVPVVHRASAMPVDVVLAGPGLEGLFLQRARRHVVDGVSIMVASPEDMVVMKILAARPKDLEDAVAILAAGGATLDQGAVRRILQELEQALDRRDLLPLLDDVIRRAR